MTTVFEPYGAEGFECMNEAEGGDPELLGRLVRREAPFWQWQNVKYNMITEDHYGRSLRRSDAPSNNLPELVFRSHTVIRLLPMLQAAGCELVPLTCAGASLMIVVPPRIDALDEDRSDIVRMPTNPDIARIRRHVFRADKLGSLPVFKLQTRGISTTYVTDMFVSRWHAEKLHGLAFSLRWTNASERVRPQ